MAVAAHPDRFVGFFVVNPASRDGLEHARAGASPRSACAAPACSRRCIAIGWTMSGSSGSSSWRRPIAAPSSRTVDTCRSRRASAWACPPSSTSASEIRWPWPPRPRGSRHVPVIVPHFGGGFFREALMAAEACPSIHFDTSSSNCWIKYVPDLTLTDVFRRAIAVAGPNRIVFGSDSSYFPRGWRTVIHGAQRAILEELGARRGLLREDLQRQFRAALRRLSAHSRCARPRQLPQLDAQSCRRTAVVHGDDPFLGAIPRLGHANALGAGWKVGDRERRHCPSPRR